MTSYGDAARADQLDAESRRVEALAWRDIDRAESETDGRP